MLRFILLLLVIFSTEVIAAPIAVTIYVDNAYKPFSYSNQGLTQGIYVDILRQAFAKMPEYDVNILAVPWNRGKNMMRQGKGLGLVPAYFHGHDWPYLYPYSLPLFEETLIAVCQPVLLKQPSPNWPEDYHGLVIGGVTGFDGWGGHEFREKVKQNKITYQEINSGEKLVTMLLKNRFDCIMMEATAYKYHQRKNPKKFAQLSSNKQPQKATTIGVDWGFLGYSAVALASDEYSYAKDFRKRFDIVIYQMKKSGDIEKILKNYTH